MTSLAKPRRRRPQLALPLESSKPRARRGRPPTGKRYVRHHARPAHVGRHPVHVTLRAKREASFFRTQILFGELRRCFRLAQRTDFRVVHYSVQQDHVHLLVEASDGAALRAGMQGLAIRLARTVNRVRGRRGKVWAERYHRHDLRTPREVRNALVYVLQNHKKHFPRLYAADALDPFSSAAAFDGWSPRAGPQITELADDPPVAKPRTWLARDGWRRHRLVEPTERPGTFEATHANARHVVRPA